MKSLKLIPILLGLSLLFIACKEKEEKLTPVQEARVVYQNTLMIKVSVMMRFFAEMAEAMGKGMAETFTKDEKKLDDVDQKIDKAKNEIATLLDSLTPVLDKMFDSVQTANPDGYKTLFEGAVLAKGVELANQSPWPNDLPRLNKTLTKEELTTIVEKIMSQKEMFKPNQKVEDITDPFQKAVIEFAQWSASADTLVEALVPFKEKKKTEISSAN